MNIVVLVGGTSSERDVSIVTGTRVCASLRRNGHQANVIDVFFGSENYKNTTEFFAEKNDLSKIETELKAKTKDVKNTIEERKKICGGFFGPYVLELCKSADIVFIGLHGSNGEDGRVQAAFDLMGIKYTGTGYLSSAISMDKNITKKVLVSEGIPMPKGITLEKGHKIEYVPFPCVVKPCCGGSSVGVSIVNNEEEFKKAIDDAFELEDEILVEEYVKGREFSVGVIEGKALPVIEIEPLEGFYDYTNKYKAGATKETCPANISEELSDRMKRWAERACEAAGIETYSRVDELVDEDGNIFCLEINTLPGMTDISLLPQEAKAMGMSYDELTEKILSVSMKKYEN